MRNEEDLHDDKVAEGAPGDTGQRIECFLSVIRHKVEGQFVVADLLVKIGLQDGSLFGVLTRVKRLQVTVEHEHGRSDA